MSSPDRSIRVAFALDEDGRAVYRVAHHGTPLLADSSLGFHFADAPPLAADLAVRSVRRRRHDAVWRPVWGEYKTIRNRYNELTVDLREQVAPRRALRVQFRVFDDGVGFRYVLPRQRAIDDFAITSEDTEFAFAGDFPAWWIPAQFGPGSGDEELFRSTPLSEMDAAATPVTVDAGDAGFATLHEADLIDYAAMNVAPAIDDEAAAPALRSELVALPDGVKVRGTAPHESPWRTLIVGDTPAELIESTLTLNLNDPCAICGRDTSWIKPGKYVGVWWEIHKGQSEWATGAALPHGASTENVKRYIDFAAAHGIPYVLAEGWNVGWADRYTTQDFLTPTPDFDLEEVVEYAKRKGVSWLAHNETGGNVTNYLEPDRAGVRALRAARPARRQDRLRGRHDDRRRRAQPLRPGDGQPLPRHDPAGRAPSPEHRGARDRQGHGRAPHVPEHPDPRGRPRHGVGGVERGQPARAPGQPPVHADDRRADELHAGDLRRDVGSGRARPPAVANARAHARALDPRRAARDLPRVPERPADAGRHPGALRGPAGARVPRAGSRPRGTTRRRSTARSATTSPSRGGAGGTGSWAA